MSGNFPPDYFAPDYFTPEYFGGEVNANGMAASIAGVATVTATLSSGQRNVEASISGAASVTADLTTGAVVVPLRRVGGSWVNPTYVKDRKRKRVEVTDDLEALYDKVMGVTPVSKEAKRAVQAVKRVVKPYREPDTSDLDWVAMEEDLRVALALRKALKAIEEDEEEALVALLMAG